MSSSASLLTALGALFSWAIGRSALRNSPAMRANAAARTDARQSASATQAVAEAMHTPEGLAALRKEAAE